MAAGVWLRLPTQSPVQVAAIRKQSRKNKCGDLRCMENHLSTATVECLQWIVEKLHAQQTYLKQGLPGYSIPA